MQWRSGGDDTGHRTAVAPSQGVGSKEPARSLRVSLTYLSNLKAKLLAAPVALPDSAMLISTLAKAEAWQKGVLALMRVDQGQEGQAGPGAKGKGKPMSMETVNKLIAEGEALVVEFPAVN